MEVLEKKSLTLRKSAIFIGPEYEEIKKWFMLYLKGSTLINIGEVSGVSSTTVRIRLSRLQYGLHHALTKQTPLLVCLLEKYPDFEVNVLLGRLDVVRSARHELLYCLELIENAATT